MYCSTGDNFLRNFYTMTLTKSQKGENHFIAKLLQPLELKRGISQAVF